MPNIRRVKESFPKNTPSIIHCIAFDYYGQRLALSTENSYIHIYDLSPTTGQWEKTYEWKAHTGCVWKLAWGHPEYGQVLASCSEDKSVIIWEEPSLVVSSSASSGSSVHASGSHASGRRHHQLSVDASHHMSSSQKSHGNRYLSSRSSDEHPNTSSRESRKTHSSSVNRPWTEKAKLVDSTSAVLDIQFSPKHLGLQLATCSAAGHIRIYEAPEVMNISSWTMQQDFQVPCKKTTCLTWNQSPFDEPMLAIGCGDGVVRVYYYNDNVRKWILLNELSGHKGTIHSVAWAPSLGRTFHLIASGSKDGTVRVWKLEHPRGRLQSQSGTSGGGNSSGYDGSSTSNQVSSQFSVDQVAIITDHKQEVWKVEWNVTGTMLFSTGDDQTVRSFRMSHDVESGIIFIPAHVDVRE